MRTQDFVLADDMASVDNKIMEAQQLPKTSKYFIYFKKCKKYLNFKYSY